MTQTNLGGTLAILSELEGDAAHLERAVDAHRAALEVYTEGGMRFEWAVAQNNLGSALARLWQCGGDTQYLRRLLPLFAPHSGSSHASKVQRNTRELSKAYGRR